MKNDSLLGVVIGVVVSAAAIAGNILRADPHLVSTFPGIFTVLVVPAVVYVVGRRRRIGGQSPEEVRGFGLRVGVIAGAVFSLGIGAFTGYWLVAWSPLAAFSASTAFSSVLGLSYFSALVAATTKTAAV